MTEQTVKTIPTRGTRKKGAAALAAFSVVAWLFTLLLQQFGGLTAEQAATFGFTTANLQWGLGMAFGVYVASETVVKGGEAWMNRNA